MRGTRMFLTVLLATAASACGHVDGTPPPGVPGGTQSCVAPAPPQVPQTDGTARQPDDGKSLCLDQGQRLGVFLGPSSPRWSAVRDSDEPTLRPVQNGSMTLPVGITAGFFQADRPGTATLSSMGPNGAHWQVQVVVRPR